MKHLELGGKVIIEIRGLEIGSELIWFKVRASDDEYVMYHDQDCCESVNLNDICGDVEDLIGYTITMAEEVSSRETPKDLEKRNVDSQTWTFYKLATKKGTVVLRWYGTSNGYYSESVSFKKLNKRSERDIISDVMDLTDDPELLKHFIDKLITR